MYLKKHMKKQMILSAVFGVFLFGFGFANFAMASEIPGIDIIVQKKPGGSAIQVKTGADGTYKFTRLAPGNYDLSVAGQHVQTIIVGANRSVSGTLSRETDGNTLLSISGLADHGTRIIRITNVRANASPIPASPPPTPRSR